MTLLEQLSQVSTIVQAVLVILSLGLILLQLRQNAELTKAANAQALVEHAGSFNALLIQNPELAKLWYAEGKGLQNEDAARRYRELLVQWLIFHENIYYQHRKKLLDEDVYNSWRVDLKNTVQQHNVRLVTSDLRTFFPGPFGRHLIKLQSEPPDPAFDIATFVRNSIAQSNVEGEKTIAQNVSR